MKYFCLFLLSVISNIVSAQIIWNKNRPLVWSDFKGTVDSTSSHARYSAHTATLVKYQYNNLRFNKISQRYTMDFVVECFFIEDHSWSKQEKRNDALLRHEQLHFDISELFARKLIYKLNSATYSSNYQDEIKAIYKQNWQESHNTQVKYDLETNHYAIKDKQKEWEDFIDKELSVPVTNINL